jgi:hypothetical protein
MKWISLTTVPLLVYNANQAYTRGYLSVFQRQGVITCLPKEGKSKFYLKTGAPYHY